MSNADHNQCPVGTFPRYDIDFYADDFIRDPWLHYAAMRDLGGVVYLPRHGNFAITRYAEVREVLHNWRVFSSAQGVAADQVGCDFLKGNTLASDPPVHDAMRVSMAAPLLPGNLEAVRERVNTTALELIDRLVGLRRFDGIVDLARILPLNIVTDLVGLPDDGRENMLLWASSSFDILGVQNERGCKGIETIKEMRRWIAEKATPDRLRPGSWTARIHSLAEAGAIPKAFTPQLIRDYINPSLDTTISATGQLIYQLGRNPEQYEKLRLDPTLIRNAVNEAVRLGTPIRSFSRTLTQEFTLGGITMPAGARAMILFASANRDERHFHNPDSFDVTRSGFDHVGFGQGLHMCVGMHLAQLEMEAILSALVQRVSNIVVGEPTVALNNTIYGFASLPVTVEPAKAVSPLPKEGTAPTQDPHGIDSVVRERVEGSTSAEAIPTGAPFRVRAARSGITFDVPSDSTILESLERVGISVPSACRSGVCATCLTPVLDGVPDHRDFVQTDEEKARNDQIAVCCSRALTSELVLDV